MLDVTFKQRISVRADGSQTMQDRLDVYLAGTFVGYASTIPGGRISLVKPVTHAERELIEIAVQEERGGERVALTAPRLKLDEWKQMVEEDDE